MSDVALVLSAFLVTLKSMFVFALLAAELTKVFFLIKLILAKSHFSSYFFPQIHKKILIFAKRIEKMQEMIRDNPRTVSVNNIERRRSRSELKPKLITTLDDRSTVD